METFAFAVLLIIVVVLWLRTGALDSRLGALQAELNSLLAQVSRLEKAALPARVGRIENAVLELTAGARQTPVGDGAKPAQEPTQAAAAAPSAAVSRAHPVIPATPDVPAAPSRPPAMEPRAASAAPVARRPAAGPAEEPSGPGWLQQVLDRLGLPEVGEGGSLSRQALEAWLEGRMLAVVGGIALVLGAVFFLSLAFSRGWITEPMRALIGLGVGVLLLVLGELAFARLRGIVGHVLVAVGLAIVALALLAATRLYGLVPVEWGLAGALVAAFAATAIAIRHDSQLVAAFALISVLAAPPVLGASATVVTLLFVAVALVGTTGVALFRTWTWLPPLAFLLSAPQLAAYVIGDVPVSEGLVAVLGFWLVYLVAAGGEEARHASERLRPATVTLLLADAGFTIWAGFRVLGEAEPVTQGAFLLGLALAHLGVGAYFLARDGDRHPFGLLVSGTGVAALAMAAPVAFGGPPVVIAWAAEAVALAWLATVRRHPYSALASVVLGSLAIGHLVVVEYPRWEITGTAEVVIPFVGPDGLTFGFVIAALALTGAIVSVAWVRAGLAGLGGLLTLYVLPFELSGPALVAGWSLVAALAAALSVRVVEPRIDAGFSERRLASLRVRDDIARVAAPIVEVLSVLARPSIALVSALGLASAIGHVLVIDFPPTHIGGSRLHAIPYVAPEGASLVVALVAMAVTAALSRSMTLRLGAAGLGLGLVAYSVSFEIPLPHAMALWAALGLAALALVRRIVPVEVGVGPAVSDRLIDAIAERLPYAAAGLALALLLAQAVWYAGPVAVAEHVLGRQAAPAIPFVDVPTYALVVVGIALVVAGWTWLGVTARAAGLVAAGVAAAWLAPLELRPHFTVAAWALIAVAGAWLVRLAPAVRTLVAVPGAALAGIAAGVTLATIAPPTRLAVDATTVISDWPVTGATIALGAIAMAVAGAAALHRSDPLYRPAVAFAGVAGVYLVSVALVDGFQGQIGSRPIDEVGKEAQVGLSVLWALLGGVGFATGLVLHRTAIRLFGLGLLGLATVKVFVVDLAALDVAYRVLSLMALGVLLLVSAAVYSRLQHPHPPASPKPA